MNFFESLVKTGKIAKNTSEKVMSKAAIVIPQVGVANELGKQAKKSTKHLFKKKGDYGDDKKDEGKTKKETEKSDQVLSFLNGLGKKK